MKRNFATRDRFARGYALPKHLDVSEAALNSLPRPAPAPAPPARTHHPVVTTTHSRWFRVIRLVRLGHVRDTDIEDIGEFPREADAWRFIASEIGNARILDSNGKVLGQNWQPIEVRS